MGSTGPAAKLPVSLAPFAFGWIGGDIHGLQALGARLSAYVPAMTDVITALERRAARLTSNSRDGWQGSAAAAFTASWQKDALAAAALAMVTGQASDIIDALAVALSQIENALETQADAAARHGVQIMPGASPAPNPSAARHRPGPRPDLAVKTFPLNIGQDLLRDAMPTQRLGQCQAHRPGRRRRSVGPGPSGLARAVRPAELAETHLHARMGPEDPFCGAVRIFGCPCGWKSHPSGPQLTQTTAEDHGQACAIASNTYSM